MEQILLHHIIAVPCCNIVAVLSEPREQFFPNIVVFVIIYPEYIDAIMKDSFVLFGPTLLVIIFAGDAIQNIESKSKSLDTLPSKFNEIWSPDSTMPNEGIRDVIAGWN